jgi:hypothetical protein
MATTEVEVPLADAIRALRRELVESIEAAEDSDLRFTLGPIELELAVQLSSDGHGEAGVHFWVVSLGAGASRQRAVTHTVKLSLTPVQGEGEVLVSSEVTRRPD